jgi:hypothetical protein
MARWQLLEPHYLLLKESAKWEYMETDRTTGKQVRKQYVVPQYFHHEAESDWTEFTLMGNGARASGIVVVSDGHNAKSSDIIFVGSPTPGMRPLDDEAVAITSKFKDKWGLPDKMFDLNEPGEYSVKLADYFVQQQDKVNMKITELAEQNTHGFSDFMKTMTSMMAQNQKILEVLAIKSTGATPVVDNLEPLPPAEEKPNVVERQRRPIVTQPVHR